MFVTLLNYQARHDLIMAALWNRTGHYIFALWFLSFFLSSFFYPRLISAATDWMSTILRHMVWLSCESRMQVWNVLHAARWKCRTQKMGKNSPSAHHRTTLSCYIFATKAHIDNRKTKKLVKQQYLPHILHNVNFGPLAAKIFSLVCGTPANFNGFRILAALLHCTVVVGISQTLRRWTEGAAGRPSRWALVHILVCVKIAVKSQPTNWLIDTVKHFCENKCMNVYMN